MGNPALVVTGTITSPPSDVAQGALQYPLDFDANITGNHTAGEWVQFTHDRGPTAQTLHPVKVLSTDRSSWHGVGSYAAAFGSGVSAPTEQFGDGRNGSLVVNSGQTVNTDSYRSGVSGTANSGQSTVSVSNIGALALVPSERVLIHQTRGSGAGNWEVGTVGSVGGSSFTLTNNLAHSYTDGGTDQAQVIHVPQYSSCSVNSGGTLTASSWDGNTGGILAIFCQNSLTVAGLIDVGATGFRGGPGGPSSSDRHGRQGESHSGTGSQSTAANGSGGGGGQGDPNPHPSGPKGSGGGGAGSGAAGATGSQGSGTTQERADLAMAYHRQRRRHWRLGAAAEERTAIRRHHVIHSEVAEVMEAGLPYSWHHS